MYDSFQDFEFLTEYCRPFIEEAIARTSNTIEGILGILLILTFIQILAKEYEAKFKLPDRLSRHISYINFLILVTYLIIAI